MSRAVVRTGLPYRTSIQDYPTKEVFSTSPPGVIFLAAIPQAVWPFEELPPRLLHYLVFGVPTFFLVWWIAMREYGWRAALFSLLVLSTSTAFLRDSIVVKMDTPLAFWSLLTLYASFNACRSTIHRRRWGLVTAVGLFLAMWTKYQALTIPAAFVLFVIYLWRAGYYESLLNSRRPFLWQLSAGLVGLTTLVAYFSIGANVSLFNSIGSNSGRFASKSATVLSLLQDVGVLLWDSLWYVGLFVLLSGGGRDGDPRS